MWQIIVFGIGTRQGCEPFKVIPPYLILVAWIGVCIIIGSPDRVIDALRQVDWLLIKFKSIVGWSPLAKISLLVIQIWSSHFCLAIIVWESVVTNSCIQHWHKTGLQTFLRLSLRISYWLLGFVFDHNWSLDRVIDALRLINWFYIKLKLTVYWLSLARFLFQSFKFGHHISVWQL